MKKRIDVYYRFHLIMKVSLPLLFLLLFACIASAHPGTTQDLLTKSITFSARNEALKSVLTRLEKATDVKFTYTASVVKNKEVTVQVANQPLDQLLKNIFNPLHIDYSLSGDFIILEQRNGPKQTETLQGPSSDRSELQPDNKNSASERKITGVIKDETGANLPGVNVMVKGTQQGDITNANGEFSIDIEDENATLVISFVGYLTQEILVGNKTKIEVSLLVDDKTLEEVVVVGYGTQKKVNMTGAVDVINGDKIKNRQSPTVSQMLQGLSPGLNFSVGDQGFQPGASMGITIRGTGSINGGSPLVIIDGFPGSMDRLNPNDIESISVLKDAAASAIYGARAPYGVILITTKSGGKDSKLTVSYSGNVMINKKDRMPQMLDSYTFAKVTNEMGDNAGGRPYTNEVIDLILAYKAGDTQTLRDAMPEGSTHFETLPTVVGTRWGANNRGYSNRDWYKEWFGTSINQVHNLSVSGGSANTSYYLSAGYTGQNGILNYGTDSFARFNLTGKIKTSVKKWWDIGYESRFMKSPREHFNGKTGGGYEGVFREIPRTVPTQSMYDGFGNISMESKIRWAEDAGTDRTETTENWQLFNTEIRPLKGWKINADFAYRSVGVKQMNIKKAVIETYVDGSLVPHGETLPSQAQQISQNNYYWSTNLFTSYDFNFKNKHHLTTLVGMQLEYDNSNYLSATRINLIVPDVPSLSTANGTATIGESMGHWATQGYFGRLNYNYDEKYLLEVNGRYDGTSRFREGRRWGFFPSFSVGWNVDKEAFWSGISDYVNTFKVRGSWGQLGNQQVSSYADLALIPLVSSQLNWLFKYGQTRPIGYTNTPGLVSPNLTWETATTKNLGINTTFLSNRLTFDLDFFERVTTNMIGPSQPLPGVLGVAVPRSNNSTLRTRGWESALTWNHRIVESGFSYSVGVNMYDARSHVTEYLNTTGLISDWYAGKEVGEIWGFTANKLYQSQEELDTYRSQVNLSNIYNAWNPGDVKYEDINGDGRVDRGTNTLSNPGDQSIIGNNTPRYQYGINLGASYKGFDFSMLIKGTAKRDYAVPNSGEQYVFWGVQNWLFTSLQPTHLDYFRDKPGDKYTGLHEGDANINLDAYWPRTYMDTNQNSKNRHASTRYLLNASYVRIQNMQLGYSLPSSLLKKAKLQNVRLYISGENLLTLTDLIDGIDPVAIGSRSRMGMTYGADRIFSFGINASL